MDLAKNIFGRTEILALLAGVGVSALLFGVIELVGRRVRLVRQFTFPLTLAALTAGLTVFVQFETGTFGALEEAIPWLWAFILTISILRLVALYIVDIHLPSRSEVRLPPMLPPVILWAAYVLTALILLPLAVPGLDVAPILATSAVTSLVLGLALQPILGNFFAGLVISFERPFRIKDWIKVGDTEGQVVNITWRTTHLRTRDNDDLVIPNGRIADQEVLNYYYPHRLHLERIYVGVHYRTPPYRVKQALMNCVRRVGNVLENPSPEVFLVDFGDSSITYELRVWIDDIAPQPAIASHIRSEIWEEFRRHGITIPFPIRTLEIEPLARGIEIVEPAPETAREDAPRKATLYVARGADSGKLLPLGEEPVTVGRAGSCELQLTIPRASKEHFRVEWTEAGYRLIDLGSSAGTDVNGRHTEEHLLADMDRISIGSTIIVFESHER